jgi:hypothetical protein
MNNLFFGLLGLIAFFLLMYGAVKYGNTEVLHEIKIQNRLLAELLKANGIHPKDIAEIMGESEGKLKPIKP